LKRVLLTGATGLVGQYLVRDLLQAGTGLVVVIRPQGRESGRQRLARILAHWEGELGQPLARPVCLEGDLTREGLGLNEEARNWVAQNCGSVLHNAASLTFVGADRAGEPWLSNFTGTRNVLEFCKAAGLREFHDVSTAYVCGQRADLIREQELDCGQEFRNDYEHSKCEAEKLVRSAPFLDRVTVYRPAIIVGDSRTGYTATYHGLYTYLQFVWLFRQHLKLQPGGSMYQAMRINLTGDEPRNLVPVDWVSAVITRIFLKPELHGRTYHLGPQRCVTAREIEDVVSDYFNYSGPTFAGPDALEQGELNTLERMFYAYVSRYQPYWAEEPRFDCTNTLAAAPDLPCPTIDRECMHRLIDFAMRDNWGRTGSIGGDVLQEIMKS
jgi:nucleoside-diphosphate-sugar epimerase